MFETRAKRLVSQKLLFSISKKDVKTHAFKLMRKEHQKNTFLDYIQNYDKTLGDTKLLKAANILNLDESHIYKNLSKLLRNYIFYRGKGPVIFIIFLYLLSIALFVFVDLWAGAWSSDFFGFSTRRYTYIWILSILVAGSFVILRDYFYYKTTTGHSNKAHQRLL